MRRRFRAAGGPAGYQLDEGRTRGPRAQGDKPRSLRPDKAARIGQEAGAGGLPRQGAGGHRVGRERRGHRRRGDGTRQALLLDIPEDAKARQERRRTLRPVGRPHPLRRGERVLRRARHCPWPVETPGRPVQGLHRDAQVERLPQPAHDGDGVRRDAPGDTDTHP